MCWEFQDAFLLCRKNSISGKSDWVYQDFKFSISGNSGPSLLIIISVYVLLCLTGVNRVKKI